MEKPRFLPGDSVLIENIVNYLKAKGIFDEFRHECLADVDTKSSCQNLSQRVDGYTTKFLANETWNPDLNKNELRNKLRRHIDESGMLAVGADHVVEQVINPKIGQLFFPRIREVVHQYLNEENLKLNKKQDPVKEEPTIAEKNFAESADSSSSRTTKSTVLDPIADILAFSYSKPTKTDNTAIKQTVPNPPVSKTENVQPKYPDAIGKQEKRKEEKNVSQSIKTEQEKKKEEKSVSQFVKTEPVESTSETSVTPAADSKPQIESKESSTKVKKEIKAEECDGSKDTLEAQKKCQKEDIKVEKKKAEDAKIQNNDGNLSEENVSNKSLTTTPQKSNVNIKIKSERTETDKYSKSDRAESDKHNKSDRTDTDKHKQKLKTTSSHKSTSNSSKAKSKETSESSKNSSEKSGKSTPSKSLKHSTKDQSSPLKSVKSSKDEKNVVSGLKLKSSDGNIKTGESSSKKLTSSKSGTPKKDNLVAKSKSVLDKAEKHKNVKDQKSDNLRSDSSSNIEKGSKSSYPHSSSYESSQGSDQERGSLTSTKERQKLFSKHFKKDSPVQKDRDKSDKKVFDKKRLAKDDVRLMKKHKEKHSKLFTLEEKQKESSTFQDSSKLGSRSDSFGSGSSLTNSPTTSKENSLSTFEESNENSSNKLTEKKKRNKEKCQSPQILPPPPPPPPSSGSLICGTSSSAEMSSLDDTQSSSESENSDSEDSDERSNIESETNESTSCSIKNAKKAIDFGEKTTSLLKPHNQSLQSDNSSSEFEGFCSSPEKEFQSSVHPLDSDVSVSSVHTSELSTFEDELTDDESSSDEIAHPKSQKMKLTVKEAREKILMKAKLGNNLAKKSALSSESKKKESNCSLQLPVSYASSEDESSVPAEPKRELRRERKLNPKYASSEYTSIFNSRKRSFITKTPEEYERKEISSESNRKKNLNAPAVNTKETQRKSSSRLSVELKNKSVPESDSDECSKTSKSDHKITLKSFAVVEQKLSDLENLSDSEDSSNISKEKLDLNNIDDDYLSDNDNSRARLKIKTANKCYNQRDLNSRPTKRKADSVIKSSNKRPCSRNSVDSCSSEFAANENKPFNNERISSGTSSSGNKSHRINNDFKDSADIRDNRKKDHKQRTSNNGDLLGKREMLRNNSHSKLHHTSGKKPDGDFNLDFSSV
ncbi:biorientation of chromosomes in cell division protein 1-like 1 [Stegodyphus dumicola]|uniref:biorientation of chromosomes in cell division protein 1-like 1 n=1 Tax=Stegodyphus dumicola TaxID=202533 RepID=UPI0015AF7094|nr:biorientation of chromosomes in cell division protein 1-like 1 [Stegodyphus dumicola]